MNGKRPDDALDSAESFDTQPMEEASETTVVPPAEPLQLAVGGATHEGQLRELNEDSWRWEALNDDVALCAVADGMGGHDSGEVASSLAVKTLFDQVATALEQTDRRDIPTLKRVLRKSFAQANMGVLECGRENASNMGTTLTTALVYQQCEALLANVGDTRAYHLHHGLLHQITRDHSLVAYLVQMGELTKEQARTHPSGNILVRSVGSTADVEIDVFHVTLEHGDALLLCTDGLWSELPDEELHHILTEYSDPTEACEQLVTRANAEGGKDNITCLVLTV